MADPDAWTPDLRARLACLLKQVRPDLALLKRGNVSVPGEQPDPIAVSLDDQAEAVVLDLV